MAYGRLTAALAVVSMAAHPAVARTLEVGPGKAYAQPSQAAAAAQDGDRILIADGEYFDCATLPQNNLTVEGASEAGTVITDKACGGKASLVIQGANVTVRNLTLTRVRVPDGNGAGIRAEGKGLTVDHVRFVNNQEGILAGDIPGGTMTVRGSEFTRNGSCERSCAHGIYVGNMALLRVEGSTFRDTREAHDIKSRAARTEVVNNDIADGPEGTASYEVDIPNGGSVVVSGNQIEKGPKAGNHTAMIMIGEEGITQATREITVEGNTVRNDGNYSTVLVFNGTATEAQVKGNHLAGQVTALHGDGTAG